MDAMEHQRQIAITWACQQLSALGITFHAIEGEDGWDVETPDGWVTAETWGGLCQIARKELARRSGERDLY